jgi:hypothetical protein
LDISSRESSGTRFIRQLLFLGSPLENCLHALQVFCGRGAAIYWAGA